MARVIAPTDVRTDADIIAATVREYAWLDRQSKDIEAKKKALKNQLSEFVEADGEADEKGHILLQLPAEIEGLKALQRQRRVTRNLDEQTAEQVLTAKDLRERCYKTIEVLDEDEVMACLYQGLLEEEDVDAMFPQTITWAFVPVKA